MDEPLKHVLRARLPWRVGPVPPECGRKLAPDALTMTHTELAEMLKEYGQKRTSLFVCMTCLETARSYAGITWETDPVRTVARECDWAARYGRVGTVRDDPSAELFRAELIVLGMLAERYADEVNDLLAAITGTPRLDTHRERRDRRSTA